jgi:hypothetical protein
MVPLRRFVALAIGGVLALILTVAAHAQVTTGTIFGRVVDTTGAVLPGATVTVTDEGTNAVKRAVTDARGDFTVAFLPVGAYTVTVSLDGFKTHTATGLAVSSGSKLDLTYTLEVGALNEVITVESVRPLLNTTSAEQDVNIGTQMVAELPIINRDIMGLLNQGTGLTVGSGSNGGNLSINGLPEFGFTFTIDGVNASPDAERATMATFNNYDFIRGTSLEAVKEVELSKNVFSAEIGMSMSGNVNIITKSGTNALHGSGFYQAQDGSWNSADLISGQKTPGTYHGFGGSLGGPIAKDKLFFFVAYEGYRDARQERQSGNVPSRQVRALGAATNPPSQEYWDIWPLPTGPENPGDTQALFVGNSDRDRNDDHITARLDYNMSSNDLLSLRYSRSRPNFVDPRLEIGNPRSFEGQIDTFSATYTRIFSNTVTSEFRFGYNKNRTNRLDGLWANDVINLDISGVPTSGGEGFKKYGTNWSLENTWSMVRGRHSLKFGALGRFWNGSRFNEEMPTYEFNTLEDFANNLSSGAQFQFELEDFQINSFDWGLFVQDDLRVGRDLMLNLGLRWDYTGVPTERDGRLFNRIGPYGGADGANPGIVRYRDPDHIYEPFYGMISPRLGFAWSMNEKTVVRGGFGVFYLPHNLYAGPVEIVQNALGEPFEFVATGEQLETYGIAYPDPSDEVKPLVSGPCDQTNYTCPQDQVFITDSSLDLERKNPYSLQWSLGVSRQLTNTLALDLAYVGSNGERLAYAPDYNRPDRFTGAVPFDNFGAFRHYTGDDSTTYHSLQTSLRRRFEKGVGFGVHYTYSVNLTYFRGDFNSGGNDEQPQEVPADGLMTPLANNRGLTPYHTRHRLYADFLWELPLGEGLLTKGWQIGGLLEVRSGTSLRILDRGSRGRGDRPDYVSDPYVDNWSDGDVPWQYLDPTAFARVPQTPARYQERPGTLGRRSYTGPGFWSFDMTLSKRFSFDQFSFQLRAEAFNVFNTTNYGNPAVQIESSSFGRITSVGEPRTWQLGVRFDF